MAQVQEMVAMAKKEVLEMRKTPYYIEQSNETRPFQNIASDMRNASCVVVMPGEQTPQMSVEIELLLRMRDIYIWWRPAKKELKKLRRRK